MVDLHYQRAEEAIKVLDRSLKNVYKSLILNEFKPNNGSEHLYLIITGAGKHSEPGKKAKLKVEVE